MKSKEIKYYKRAFTAEQKIYILNAAKHSSIEWVARTYHCSVRSIFRWKKKYDGTVDSLKPNFSRVNMLHPNRHTDEEIKHIRDLLRRNPNIGLNELYGKLRLNYAYTRNPVSLYRFLRKHGWYIEKKQRIKYIPQHYDTPIKLGVKWQLDVKYVPRACYVGEFKEERQFYQYTVIDEASRERFIFPYKEQCAQSTIDFIKRAIIHFRYKPKCIQTDNGSEFTYTRETKEDKEHLFDTFCRLHKIIHKTIRPRTPRHNGKVERSHRNDQKRFYQTLKFYSYEDLQRQMKAYLERSNNIPISTLKSRDLKNSWLTPNEKRKELLLLDYGIVE